MSKQPDVFMSFNYRAFNAHAMSYGVNAMFFTAFTLGLLFNKGPNHLMTIASAPVTLVAMGYLGYYLIIRRYSRLWLDDQGIHYHHPVFKHNSWHIPYTAIHLAELGLDHHEFSQTLTLHHHDQQTVIQLDEWHLPKHPIELVPAFEHPVYLELERLGLIPGD